MMEHLPASDADPIAEPLAIVDQADLYLGIDAHPGRAAPLGVVGLQFVVEDVLEEYQEAQPEFADMQAPIDKEGAEFFLNQNSREPVTEPDEMVPLWKILHLVGADWTYGTKGWAAENYCMFLADNESWEHIVKVKAKAVDDLKCKVWLNTE